MTSIDLPFFRPNDSLSRTTFFSESPKKSPYKGDFLGLNRLNAGHFPISAENGLKCPKMAKMAFPDPVFEIITGLYVKIFPRFSVIFEGRSKTLKIWERFYI